MKSKFYFKVAKICIDLESFFKRMAIYFGYFANSCKVKAVFASKLPLNEKIELLQKK